VITAPSVSAIVPNYRRPALLVRCLESLRDCCEITPTQVVVVDDGSNDESCDLVSKYFPQFLLVSLEKNRGYPAAINAGLRASSGDWILTLNNDAVIESDALRILLEVANSSEEIGSLAAQQRFLSHPQIISSAGVTVDRRGQASDRLIGHSIADSEHEPIEVFGACGAAALYRRSMLDELGGFDERFIFGLEDVDVSWRGQMRGWRCLYVPGAVVYHDLGATVPYGSKARFVQAGRNRMLLIAKNMSTRQLLRYGLSIVMFDVLYVVYTLLRAHTLSPLRGRWQGLRLWRSMRRAGALTRRPVELERTPRFSEVIRRRQAVRFATNDSTDSAAVATIA
jgi:GT2 family glycosyltransferase